MDLIDDDEGGGAGPGDNAHEFTVSEISGAVKRSIEGEFSHIRVRGEVGRVSRPRSGHVYMDLKDDRSVLSGVIWKGVSARLATQPEEGLEVIATGRLTTFPGQSKYQIVIEDIRPAGAGALMAMLEERKKKLAAEGLFDASRKRAIPFLPDVIGVITSPSGAVIRDILHRLRDRFPRKVLVWPVAVQGAKCAPEVARAIEGFNALTPGGAVPRPDLIIVARGGGSIEDLWGFNEEIVARAAAESGIPLISAVGHETDTTLIDFVSDFRAPTPTAAAEKAVPVRLDLLAWVDQQDARLTRAMTQATGIRRQRLMDLSRALPRPETLVSNAAQRLDLWADRLPRALIAVTRDKRVALADAAAALRPSTLKRGVSDRAERTRALSARLPSALSRAVSDGKRRYADRAGRLRIKVLEREIAQRRRDLDALSGRLGVAGKGQVADWRARLDGLERLRQTLGYTETLERGYAVIRSGADVVTRKAEAEAQGALEIEFADGRLGVIPGGGGGGAKPRKKSKPPEQGSLF